MDANLLLKPEQVDVDVPPSWKCNLILIIYFCNYVIVITFLSGLLTLLTSGSNS